MTNPKTKQQVRKHNDKSDKPEEVGIVWDSAIGLGIDYSPLTGRDICQSRYRKNHKKHSRVYYVISSSGTGGRSQVMCFWRDRPVVRSHLWPNFFFSLPFQISYRIVKAFIFNKNERNNQKVEKVSGRVLHYVKIAGCSAMYTNVTCCK